MRGYFNYKTALLIALGFVLLTLPAVNTVLFPVPVVAAPSAIYDCDDATLDLYNQFKQAGIPAVPIVGNLEMIGESFTQCNHVWLLATIKNTLVAYDWGQPRFDSQHYEGFEIKLDYLQYAVSTDRENPELLGIANQAK